MLSGEVVGRRRGGVLVATLVVLACLVLTGAPVAMGAEFLVDSTADEVDAAPGDESCRTAAEECTLRAAIEEGNGLGEFTRIDFEEETFEGQVAATITLGEGLPAVTVPAFINGRTCDPDAVVGAPCVGIDGPSGEPALIVANAEEVEISGLAITGAQTAISLEGSPRTKIQGSWIGVALDRTLAGNETGVLVRPGSNRSLIGGEGVGQGNVIAGNAGDGLDVHGGNSVRVFGNYFGVEPDGATPAANSGDDIEVVSIEGSEVTGTAIGTRLSTVAAASSLCDGGCNVIAGATLSGIDLEGDGGLESEAVSTSIAGNYIGLSADGSAAVANAGAGVRVGEAPGVAIGGPSTGEANRITGGSAAVLAGPAAGDLVIRNNFIGTDASGASILGPPDDGIVVDSAELASPADEAEIVGNVIGMEDGVAIAQRGEGAWILGNEIFGSQIGIKTLESSVPHGNVVEGNSIEGPATNGILLETGLNEIVGNEILGAGAAGIRVVGTPPNGVSGNLVGGNTAEDENFIADSGGAAIEIFNPEETRNEVARNLGVGNAGSFIDLIPVSPEAEAWPNWGIEPPTFSAATQTEASGGAEEGATVRVFRKQLAAAGELESFLGEAVANGAGFWELTFEAAIPPGTAIAATQTKDGATSELAIATTPGAEGVAGGGAGGGAFGSGAPGSLENAIARIRPQTKIVRGKSRRRAARFAFRSDQAGSAFLCKLDGKPFDLCKSPKQYVGLAPGKHVFWVRAIDPGGRVDLSPAKKKFVVPG